jgi:heat-inducible transcriptional repressor
MKSLVPRKPPKNQREHWVLLGLVELYLETGKPIGSNTLKEKGFEALSAATIRNYFAKLEEEGYLKQQHSSGGRIPTAAAYKLYAETYLNSPQVDDKEMRRLQLAIKKETRELATYLQAVAESLSEASKCAVFLSAPRFDHDVVMDIKMVTIDAHRVLCVLITDFGQVHTEVLYTDKKMGNFTLKRLESFFRWKLTGLDQPKLPPDEEAVATRFYSEVMMRHLVGSSHFTADDIYKTGFSKLLSYPDFNDATALAEGLGLFEDEQALRALLQECAKAGDLSCWIGSQLHACSVIAIPYKIHQKVVGTIALLGPNRIPYRKLFGQLKIAAETISDSLTKSLYKFKITFRQSETSGLECLLLENKK